MSDEIGKFKRGKFNFEMVDWEADEENDFVIATYKITFDRVHNYGIKDPELAARIVALMEARGMKIKKNAG